MLTRKAPLARSTKPMKRSPMRRTAFKRKSPKNPVPAHVYDAVFADSGGRCVRCQKPGYMQADLQLHHKRHRSQGGEHSVENCVMLCLACHLWVESHPADAMTAGLWTPSGVG